MISDFVRIIYILIDAGSTVDFLSSEAATLTIEAEGDVTVSHNGQTIAADSTGSFIFAVAEGDVISVTASGDKFGKITLTLE